MYKIKDAAVIFIAVTHHAHVQLSRTLSCSSLVSTHMLQACNEFLKRCVLCRTCQGMFGGGRAEREREKEWEWYCGREWVVSACWLRLLCCSRTMQMRMRFVADYDVDYIAAAPTATFPRPLTNSPSDGLSVHLPACLSVRPSVCQSAAA